MPATTAGMVHSYHLFVIKPTIEAANLLLNAEHVEHGIHYPVPVHRMPAAAQGGKLPRS